MRVQDEAATPKAGGEDDDSEEEDGEGQGSKRKKRLEARMKIAALKQVCPRPDVVEVWDVTSTDPKLLVWLKVCPPNPAVRILCHVPHALSSRHAVLLSAQLSVHLEFEPCDKLSFSNEEDGALGRHSSPLCHLVHQLHLLSSPNAHPGQFQTVVRPRTENRSFIFAQSTAQY